MRLITTDDFNLENTIVTLGKFDGNHIGHRSLFAKAKEIKAESKGLLKTVVFTFDINPHALTENTYTDNIYTGAERAFIEENEGIDCILVWPFNEANRSMSPESFIRDVLVGRLGAKYIVVGEDFRFGKDRGGSVETLRAFGSELGFRVIALPKVKYKGEEVSSSRIKKEIAAGNLEDANFMLGGPFAVTGLVVPGKHLGHKIGFPTINFQVPEGKVLPPNGVYATKTYIEGKEYLSASNIGVRPSVSEGSARNVETNIMDFSGDVYGQQARVEFYKFIRPERKFDSLAALSAEIEKNKVQIRDYFKTENGKY